MAPKRGGGSSFGSSSGSSFSDYLVDAADIYHYRAIATIHGLLGTAIAYSIILLLLLFTIRNKYRWLTLPFLAAQILIIIRFSLVLSHTDVSIWFRLENNFANLLLRIGLLLLFLATIRQQQALRRTFTTGRPTGGVFSALRAITYTVFAVYAVVTAAWVILGFVFTVLITKTFVDDSSLQHVNLAQERTGQAMPWLGVGLCLLLLGHSMTLLGLAKRHTGPRPSGSRPLGLLVTPLGLLFTSLLEGIVSTSWPKGEGFLVAYSLLWMLGVVVSLGAVGYSRGRETTTTGVVFAHKV